jgi:preprotein translocase subunit SecG
MKVHKLPPLQLGHEFDGWSEFQVTGRVTMLQRFMLFFSSLFFFGLTLTLVFFAIASKPERVREEWHQFELQCLPQPPDQGFS